MKNRPLLLAIVAGLAAIVLAGCSGDTTNVTTGPGATGISVSGIGRVTVEPDVALVNLGVEVTEPTVAEARERAAIAMDAVRASLRDNGVEDADIRTVFFGIFPQQSFPEDGPPRVEGYVVTNQIEIKVRDIDNASTVLDGAIDAGGDDVRASGINFTIDDPEQYFAEARELAVADARARAQALADLADIDLGDVISVSESSGGGAVPFPANTGFGGAFDEATSISPGESEIVLSVFVLYGIN